MNLRWLWFDHIPPELEVPKEARAQVIAWAKEARKKDPKLLDSERRSERIYYLIGFGFLAALFFVDWQFWPGFDDVAIYFALAAIWPIATWSWHVLHGPFVRRALCQLGYLCCVRCGYPHTGLSKDVKVCPECGAAREFGKCIHCNSPPEWAMEKNDKCTKCGRLRLS